MSPAQPDQLFIKLQNCLICLVVFALILMFVYNHKSTHKNYDKNKEVVHGTVGLITLELSSLSGITGLGNKLYDIATLYGIASILQMVAYFPEHLRLQVTELKKVFPHFDPLIMNVPNSKTISFGQGSIYENVSNLLQYTNQDITLNGSFYSSWRYFDHTRKNILDIFAFSTEDLNAASSIVEDAQRAISTNFNAKMKANYSVAGKNEYADSGKETAPTNKRKVVCVHIRRRDFLMINMASRKHSTYNSVCFVRRKNAAKNEKNILFLVLGDDRSWAEDLFRLDHDVFISPEPKRAAVDLALMAKYCDDIILTASASTFGFWGAYLAKKATVYYNAESYDFRTKHDADVFLPHWIPLNLSGNTLDENTKKTAGHYYTKLVEVV